ncbi:M16 family metallopeptidase [Sphingomonas colocasiae]|uniref:Insulinase family protein n=1 Tax=Sphingomonas colocasiae TaxID=1848973 RepID=A0ABS7PPY0_9SPHN|nr:insulinase family protein [Sphingomonas colocasiae]MBY8823246.1 insulinase family protein [Sphingomonas colocasiae]
MRIRSLLIASCGLLILAGSTAAAAGMGRKPAAPIVRLDPEVRHGKLGNGFTYYIRRVKSSPARIETRLVVKAGFNQQDDDQIEHAHLVEHIVANHVVGNRGTIWDWVPSWGGQIARDFGAYTSDDRTAYKLSFPADRPDLLAAAIEISRGWAQGASLGAKDSQRERKAVLAEILRTRTMGARLMDQYMPQMTRYYRSWASRQASIEKTDDAPVLRYYRDWYRPDLQALIVVGDVDPEAVEAMIVKHFSDMAPLPDARSPAIRAAPLETRSGFRIVTDPEAKELHVKLLAKRRAPRLTGYAAVRERVIAKLVDAMFRERETALIHRYDAPLLMSDYDRSLTAISEPLAGEVAMAISSYRVRPESIREGLEAGLAVRRSVLAFGFTPDELDFARTFVERQDLLADRPVEARVLGPGSIMEGLVNDFVTGEAFQSWAEYEESYRHAVRSLTVAELNKAAREALAGSDRDILVVSPEKLVGSLPSEATLRRWIAEAERRPAVRYTPRPSPLALKTKVVVPAYAGTVRQTRHDAMGITKVVIPENGVTVLFKPDLELGTADPRGGQIQFAALRPIGPEIYKGDDYLNARFAANLASAGGVAGLDKFETDRLVYRNTWMSSFYDEDGTVFLGGALRDDFDTLMQMVYGRFTHVQRSDKGFAHYMKAEREYRSRPGDKSPKTLLFEKLEETVRLDFADHPKRTAQNIDRIDYEKSLGYFEQAVSNAGEFLFVVTGRYDPEDIIPIVTRYLSRLPANGRGEMFSYRRPIQFRSGPFDETIRAGDGENASVTLMYTGLSARGLAAQSRFRAFDNILKARLRDRLREKENGTYAVSFSTEVSSATGEFDTRIGFDCKVVDVERMIAATLSEIVKLQTEGPTAAEIASALELEKTHMLKRTDNIWFWPGYLLRRFIESEGADSAFLPEKTEPVAAADIKALANDLLKRDQLKRFVVLPEDPKAR